VLLLIDKSLLSNKKQKDNSKFVFNLFIKQNKNINNK